MLQAACVKIQTKLNRALLWCACRHHIGEVILDHVFEGLKIEVSKSPEISLFKRFQKHWQHTPRVEDGSLTKVDISNTTKIYNNFCYLAEATLQAQSIQALHTVEMITKKWPNFAKQCWMIMKQSMEQFENQELCIKMDGEGSVFIPLKYAFSKVKFLRYLKEL